MTIPGTVTVAGPIAPTATTDVYPSHIDIYGQGGYRAVADSTARDAITANRRSQGMLVKVLNTGTFYTLNSDLTTWTPVEGRSINVKDYGAVGDGATDDTSAIQAAINAAIAGVAYTPSIFFPTGNYKVSSALTITIPTVGFEIYGAGQRNPIDGGSGSIITYTGSGTMITLTNAMSLFIHDIGFAGSGTNYGSGSTQTCMKWLEVGVGTGMSTYKRVTWYGFDTAVQFADSFGMFGCADVGFDFCVVYNCNYGIRVFNLDGCNYIFRRLYANNTNSVISSVPGMMTFVGLQFVGCGSATRYAMEWTAAGNNNGAVIIDGAHLEGVTKNFIYFQGGRLQCTGIEEAQSATGYPQFTIKSAEVEVKLSRFTSGSVTTPLTMIQDGVSKRPRIIYDQCYFDREVDADTYKSIIAFQGDTSFVSGFKIKDCSATQGGAPIPIVDAGGRVQDGLVHLLATTTTTTPTELTTTGGSPTAHNRVENQYGYRSAEIRVLGLSGGKWCRFYRHVVFNYASLVSLQKTIEDQDSIGGCSLSITVPDGGGMRVTVTGPAATCTWWAEVRIVSCGLQDQTTAVAGSTFPAIGLAYHEGSHESNGADPLPWTTIHGRGLASARPTASASNAGYLYNSTDTGVVERSNGTSWDSYAGSGGGSASWGAITGTLSSQTDLNTALGLKYDKAGGPIGTDPGGSELVRVGGTFRASGNYAIIGTQATTGNTTLYVEGGSSGTSGGANITLQMNGVTHASFGNFSSVFGGAYDNRAVVYGDVGLVLYSPTITEPNTTSHIIGTDPGGTDLLRVGGSITAGTNVIKGGSLILGTSLGTGETLQVNGSIHVAGTYSQFGVVATTGQYTIYVDGGNSGTSAGSSALFRMNSGVAVAIGSYSAVMGTAADSRGIVQATTQLVLRAVSASAASANEVVIGGGTIRIARTANAGSDEVVRGDDTRLAAWASKTYPTDSSGWLNNNGAGVLSWSTPTASQVGALPASGGTTNYLAVWSSASALTSSQYLPAANHPALTGDVTTTAGSLATTISASSVTLAKMANLAANSVIGNNTGSPATPIALSQTQLTALVNTFTSTLSGAVPSSGGGTSNFLRADGTWATPSSGSAATAYDETPSGTIDGTNATFTLSTTPVANSLNLFRNGVRQVAVTDYTLSGVTIVFVIAPAVGSTLRASYFSATGLNIAGDSLSQLIYSPISVTGFTSLDATHFGKTHSVGGLSGTYNIVLPPVTGNSGKMIAFQCGPLSALSNYVLLYQANTGENIILGTTALTYVSISAGDFITLSCDGALWWVVSLKRATVVVRSAYTTAQVITAFSTSLAYNTSGTDWEDSHGAWNGSTFTAPVAGLYQFHASTQFASGVGAYTIHALVNNTEDITSTQASASDQVCMLSGITRMNAGWPLVFRSSISSTRTTNVSNNKMSIVKVGE